MNEIEKKCIWILNPWDALAGEVGFDRGMRLAEGFVASGFSVLWFNSSFSHAEKKRRTRRESVDGVRVVLVPTVSYRSHTGLRRLISLLCYSFLTFFLTFRYPPPRVIFTSGPVPFSLVVLLWYRVFYRSKVVTELRDLWPEGSINLAPSLVKKAVYKALAVPVRGYRAAIFANSDALVFLNKTYEKWFNQSYPDLCGSSPSIVSYPSPFASSIDELTSAEHRGSPCFLFSGTLGASHDHLLLLQALSKRSFPSATFILTGDGPNRERLQRHIDESGLRNVYITGYLPEAMYKKVLKESDVGIALYHRGSPVSMPTKVIDYINAGKPVIVSSTNLEAASIVSSTDTGFVINSLDDLLAAISKYCEEPDLIARHRANVLALRAEFEPSRQVEKIVSLVSELI